MANELDTAQGMIALLKGDNADLLARADADAFILRQVARERDAAIAEQAALRDLARDLCEAVERWTGHGTYPEDSVLIGDIREAAATLRDALDGRA